jgi:hypothetical protein
MSKVRKSLSLRKARQHFRKTMVFERVMGVAGGAFQHHREASMEPRSDVVFVE